MMFVSLLLLMLQSTDSMHVLFIGNSYISSNSLPAMISQIADSMDLRFEFEGHWVGGGTLQKHAENEEVLDSIKKGMWDYVVLQEQSQRMAFPLWQSEQESFPFISRLNALIVTLNENAKTVLFQTWGRNSGDRQNCRHFEPLCTFQGMHDLIERRYIRMAREHHAILCPVGRVWRHIRDGTDTLNLYASDGSHPSPIGSYVAAVCFYTILFQRDPTEIAWNGNPEWNIKHIDAEFIKETAKSIIYDHLDAWIDATDCDSDVCFN